LNNEPARARGQSHFSKNPRKIRPNSKRDYGNEKNSEGKTMTQFRLEMLVEMIKGLTDKELRILKKEICSLQETRKIERTMEAWAGAHYGRPSLSTTVEKPQTATAVSVGDEVQEISHPTSVGC